MKTQITRFTIPLLALSLLVSFNVMPQVAQAAMPATTSISPSVVQVGSNGFTLTINGVNFETDSVVEFEGSGRTTTYVSSTRLTALINASDIDATGVFDITVDNPGTNGGTSNSQLLTVSSNNPVPTLSNISPNSIVAGAGGFIMTLNGNGFNSNSVVRFNGLPRTTTFVSGNQLTAVILASDLASSGSQVVFVANPTPGGGNSNWLVFNVTPTTNIQEIVPTLPNTGFGPPDDGLTANTGIMALVGATAIFSSLMVAYLVRKAWIANK